MYGPNMENADTKQFVGEPRLHRFFQLDRIAPFPMISTRKWHLVSVPKDVSTDSFLSHWDKTANNIFDKPGVGRLSYKQLRHWLTESSFSKTIFKTPSLLCRKS